MQARIGNELNLGSSYPNWPQAPQMLYHLQDRPATN